MKQLLTVMAIMLFASLTQGFTVPNNTQHEVTSSKNFRTNNAKWQHTTWVNPWIRAKKSNIGSDSLSPAVIDWTWDAPGGVVIPPANFKIYVNDVLIIESDVSGGIGEFSAPAGSTVRLEINVNPIYALTVRVSDETVNSELYFSDNLSQVSFSYTAVANHRYEIYANA